MTNPKLLRNGSGASRFINANVKAKRRFSFATDPTEFTKRCSIRSFKNGLKKLFDLPINDQAMLIP